MLNLVTPWIRPSASLMGLSPGPAAGAMRMPGRSLILCGVQFITFTFCFLMCRASHPARHMTKTETNNKVTTVLAAALYI